MDKVYHQAAQELSGLNLANVGQLRLKVTSNSMSPLVKSGDYLLVRPVSIDSIKSGDILVTQRVDGFLTHRYIGKDARGWITKGDRNCQADSPIQEDAIVGLVVSTERNGRLRNLRTRFQILRARFLSRLGWNEINCKSVPATRLIRLLSRILSFTI